MNVLVANLGSTSFKFKLMDMSADGAVGERGGFDRIGQPGSKFASHADVIDVIINQIKQPPDAIGFKAVHGGPISVRVNDDVLKTMQEFSDVAPAHNPAYIAAMKAFAAKLPDVPQVACFETAFHQTIPMSRQIYAVPFEWTEKLGIRRYGFHGASHQWVATRLLELLGKEKSRRIISCHLGGSCSVCAIDSGKSVASSFGMTPQSGVFHNNRVGDFDIFAMLRLSQHGFSLDDVLKKLSKESGLLGISGLSNDMRDVLVAATNASSWTDSSNRAQLAIDAFVESVRHFIGAYIVALGGCDVLAFTGGIGENATTIREAICRDLEFLGIVIDTAKNHVRGKEERISAVESDTEIWVVPANEELIVARQTQAVLEAN